MNAEVSQFGIGHLLHCLWHAPTGDMESRREMRRKMAEFESEIRKSYGLVESTA